MMSKRMIFVNAHRIAKLIVSEVGNYMIAFKLALKNVWHAIKTWNKKRFTKDSLRSAAEYLTTSNTVRRNMKIATSYYEGIPLWVMQKNLTASEYEAINCDGASPVINKETEKAIDFEFDTDFGVIYMWCPKSVCKPEYANIINDICDKPEYQSAIAKVVNA